MSKRVYSYVFNVDSIQQVTNRQTTASCTGPIACIVMPIIVIMIMITIIISTGLPANARYLLGMS